MELVYILENIRQKIMKVTEKILQTTIEEYDPTK